jgi:hypothetical protein
MSNAWLALSMAPPVLWALAFAVVSISRGRSVASPGQRLAAWSYSGAYCVLWTASLFIVSLWPLAP